MVVNVIVVFTVIGIRVVVIRDGDGRVVREVLLKEGDALPEVEVAVTDHEFEFPPFVVSNDVLTFKRGTTPSESSTLKWIGDVIGIIRW